jgi:hypothetical protein
MRSDAFRERGYASGGGFSAVPTLDPNDAAADNVPVLRTSGLQAACCKPEVCGTWSPPSDISTPPG